MTKLQFDLHEGFQARGNAGPIRLSQSTIELVYDLRSPTLWERLESALGWLTTWWGPLVVLLASLVAWGFADAVLP
jgi:hypothetical protein